MDELIAAREDGAELHDVGDGLGYVLLPNGVKSKQTAIAAVLARGYWDVVKEPSEEPLESKQA